MPPKKSTKRKKDESEEESDQSGDSGSEEEVVKKPAKKTARQQAKEDAEVAEGKSAKGNNPHNLAWTMDDTVMVLDVKDGDRKTIPGGTIVVGFDMDGTIIKPKDGRTFPRGRTDWEWFDDCVPAKLKKLHAEGKKVVIFTNQAGIGTGTTKKADIQGKILDIQKILGFPFQAFAATKDDLYRKPAVKMWEEMFIPRNDGVVVDKSQSYYVGDAAGRPKSWDGKPKTKKDFSAGDKGFGLNNGLIFQTPEEFFLGHKAYVPKATGASAFVAAVTASTAAASSSSSEEKKSSSSSSGGVRGGNIKGGPLLPAKKNQEVVVFVGFPAAGKSTFARNNFVPAGYTHVNQDTMKTKEKCLKACKAALANGDSVVIDNTNPKRELRKLYIDAAKDVDAGVRCFRFMADKEQAGHLNMYREKITDGAHKHVSRIAYNVFNKNFEAPSTKEGFSEVNEVTFVADFPNDRALKLFQQQT